MIGSQQRRINIVPDYLLVVDGRPAVVLDAKSPSEDITKSRHNEQVYSYAIHPEIRASMYGLCNGRRLLVWDRDRFDPVLDLAFEDFDSKWQSIEKVLGPEAVRKPFLRDFLPDLGLSLLKAGYSSQGLMCFWSEFPAAMLMRVADDLYSVSGDITSTSLESQGMETHIVTLDMTASAFAELIECLPEGLRSQAVVMVTRYPYQAWLEPAPRLAAAGLLGDRTRVAHEDFVPFVVKDVRPAIQDPVEIAKWAFSLSATPRNRT